jgi:uncharacterized membrane protein YhhN
VTFRNRRRARWRAAVAAVIGLGLVMWFGPTLVVPALALPALVYYAHQLAAVAAGDDRVPYPSLAFVIVVNAAAVLVVQVLLAIDSMRTA